jgi:uncharacterized protein (TIGR03086 family)
MTIDLAQAHHDALGQTRRIVAGIKDDQWQDPTPCDDWDVRALLQHVVSGNRWVKPLVDGQTIEQVGDRLDGDLLGADAIAAYEASAAEADAAFSAAGALDVPVAVSYGPVPASVYCGHRLLDVFVHGWDLAAATGQDTALDPDLAAACWSVVEPELEMLVASGAFGTTHEAPADADAATRLLLVLGREPR